VNPQPKPKTLKNTDYENFVRKPGDHFHHESRLPDSGGGKSLKCSSYYGVSLRPDKHRQREAINSGFDTFWSREFCLEYVDSPSARNVFIIIELQRIVIKNLIAYIESKRGRK